MKNCIRILLFIFMLLAFLSVFLVQTEKQICASEVKSLDFQLQDLNQETVTLSNYRDKQPVLLFFWTTWCPYCRIELKVINDRYEKLAKDGLQVLAINVGESTSKVLNFTKNYHLAFRVLLDKDATVASSYRILGVPTYILIDKKGYIRFEGHHFPQKECEDLIS